MLGRPGCRGRQSLEADGGRQGPEVCTAPTEGNEGTCGTREARELYLLESISNFFKRLEKQRILGGVCEENE